MSAGDGGSVARVRASGCGPERLSVLGGSSSIALLRERGLVQLECDLGDLDLEGDVAWEQGDIETSVTPGVH